MTASRSHRFKARRLIKTLTNYIFSESWINEDYHNVFIKRKKDKCLKTIAIVLQKYMACNIQVLCSRKRSKWRDIHCAKFLTPLSKQSYRRILISCLVCFLRPASGFEKNIVLVPSFVYNSRKNGKNQKHRHCFWASLYRNILTKFELERLKIRCTRT